MQTLNTYEAFVYLTNGDFMRTIVAAKSDMDATDYLQQRYECKRIKLWELGTRNEESIFRGEFF